MGFIDVRNGAPGGAGDTADFTLGAALTKHFAGIGVVGMNDHSVGDVATKLGVRMSGRVKNFGINSADPSFGISGLDG